MPRLVQDGLVPGGGGGGTAVGDVSRQVAFTLDIVAVTAPTPGTKGNFDTLDHPDAITTGQRFEFTVPDDYDSGDLILKSIFAMSTAVAADIVVERAAEIAKTDTGAIDTATYSAANLTVTPPTTTNIDRQDLLVIVEGDFVAGDVIQFFIKRLGADGADAHTGDWQVIGYEITYTGQVATREVTQHVQFFGDTDEPAPAAGTKGNFDTLDYSAAADNEQQFQVHVPDNWDQKSDLQIRAVFAMSSAFSGTVIVATEGDIANPGSALTTFAAKSFPIFPPVSTDIKRTTVVRSIPAADLVTGASILVKFARRPGSDPDDTHTGLFKVLAVEVVTGVGPKIGFSSVLITENYLFAHDFEQVSGSATAEQESPTLAGDFETYMKVTGAAPSDRVDITWQGRLRADQATITSIKIPVQGTGDYQLKVYVEDGPSSTNVFGASALTPAPGARTLLTLTDADLSAQPGSEKRFIIAMEITVDAAEVVRVGRPFVKQE